MMAEQWSRVGSVWHRVELLCAGACVVPLLSSPKGAHVLQGMSG